MNSLRKINLDIIYKENYIIFYDMINEKIKNNKIENKIKIKFIPLGGQLEEFLEKI